MDERNELHNAAAALGRKGGKSKSDAKISAARTNGKRGGRPKMLYPLGKQEHYPDKKLGDIIRLNSTIPGVMFSDYVITEIDNGGFIWGVHK